MNRRSCGVLLPLTCIPSPHGIGGFTKEAYEFVDFLVRADQSWWQILPLGPTSYGDSPYQSFSTFAGNPYFIDLEELIGKGWLDRAAVDEADRGINPSDIDYGRIYRTRFALLREAYRNSPIGRGDDTDGAFFAFCAKMSAWLPDYCLFMALKDAHGGRCYIEWEEDIRLRREEALQEQREKLSDEIRFYAFLQYLFFEQWERLKKYANERGIRIIGDIPIYVAFDSADTWSHPEYFQFDENGLPTAVAGCPPDGFSATGQLWGNPLYRWDYHRQTNFDWWMERLSHCFTLYDAVRIDHFRGFDEYYAIPYGDTTAERGRWCEGPGIALFEELKKRLGDQEIIAEDLGFLKPSVIELVKKTGYPGMKVLEFAFDSRESSDYLPHSYIRNCVVYTGTHDNATCRGWYSVISAEDRAFADAYADIHGEADCAGKMVRLAFASVADTAIIPIQDYLNLGDEARINTPSTLGCNWRWRLVPGQLTDELADRMGAMARCFRRGRGY